MITTDTWVGLNDLDTADTYVWSDAPMRTPGFFHWAGVEPDRSNEHCVTLSNETDHGWHDGNCVWSLQSLCKKKLPFIGDSWKEPRSQRIFLKKDRKKTYSRKINILHIFIKPWLFSQFNHLFFLFKYRVRRLSRLRSWRAQINFSFMRYFSKMAKKIIFWCPSMFSHSQKLLNLKYKGFGIPHLQNTFFPVDIFCRSWMIYSLKNASKDTDSDGLESSDIF